MNCNRKALIDYLILIYTVREEKTEQNLYCYILLYYSYQNIIVLPYH